MNSHTPIDLLIVKVPCGCGKMEMAVERLLMLMINLHP